MIRNTRRRTLVALALAGLVLLLALVLPRLLVLDNAKTSDYIVVLDGHDENYFAGLQLLRQGRGSRMLVCLDLPDVPIEGDELRRDRMFIEQTAGNLAERIETCPNRDEDIYFLMNDLFRKSGVSSVLIVTPAACSRTQYITSRRQLPKYDWSVRPTYDPTFSANWWRKRLWAKTFANAVVNLGIALTERRRTEQSVEQSAKSVN